MTDFYIGRQWVTERRQWLIRVVADSVEDARVKMDAGEGVAYAYVKAETVSVETITDIQEDLNA